MKYSVTTSVLLFFSSLLFSQAQKQLDDFSSTSNYYMGVYPAASGTINATIDGVVFQEGTSSLKINYTLNNIGNNFVEVLKSYGSNTLDLSFMPNGLSLWIKGQTGNSDIFKLMLYEDQNMNGTLDAADDIFEYVNTSVLSNSGWTKLTAAYSSFTKSGGGTGVLNLNRIRAWRLVVLNGTGTSHSGTVYFDDLEQQVTYTPATTGTTTLNGSFIQLWNTSGCNCGQWSQAQWDTELTRMKNLCMSYVYVQYGFYENNAWYQPSNLSYATYSNPTINRIISAAEKTGIKVVLGLYFSETWNGADYSNAATYSTLLNKDKEVINEIWNLFGYSPAFAGWYIPQEIEDLNWQTNSKRNLLANWLQNVGSYAKTKDVSKEVSISPYFGPFKPADFFQQWYDSLLTTATSLTRIFLQDGMGVMYNKKALYVDMPNYLNALKNACDKHGVNCGATIESFLQTQGAPINNNPWQADPANINRLKSQLWEESKIASRLIQFEWAYMEPSQGPANTTLYNNYMTYASGNCSTTKISQETEQRSFTLYPNPLHTSFNIKISPEIILKDARIKIYDVYGKEVKIVLINSNETTIERAEFKDGLYFYEVINGDENIAKGKLVIQ